MLISLKLLKLLITLFKSSISPLESSDLEISFMLFNSQANCLMILYLSFNKGIEVVPLNISSSCSNVIFSKYSTFNKSYPF